MSPATRAEDWLAAAREAVTRGMTGHALRALDKAQEAGAPPDRVALMRGRALVRTDAREDGLAALDRAARDGEPSVAGAAAHLLVEAGEVARGVRAAERVLARAPTQRHALEATCAGARMGWPLEAIAATEALTSRPDASSEDHLRAARLFESLRDDARATRHAEAALGESPRASEAWLVLARAHARAARWERAREAATEASRRAGNRSDLLTEAADAHALAGDVDAAEAVLARIIAIDPHDARPRAWRAELALWRLDLDEASARAADALAIDGRSGRARMVLGAVAMFRGDLEGAERALDQALDASPDLVAARHFRGEVRRRRGRHADARLDFDLAIAQAERHAVLVYANRMLSIAEEVPWSGETARLETHPELVRPIAPLIDAADEARARRAEHPIQTLLARAIEAAGGNRSTTLTRLTGGRLTPVAIVHDARATARYHQETLRTQSIAGVLAGFDDVLAVHGEQPTIHCHRGETLLWVGRHAEAITAFERALTIARDTRWAWIGLAAAQLYAGDLVASDRTFQAAFVHAPPPGRTLFTYRAELRVQQGRWPEAEVDLAQARHMNPERLALRLLEARIALALGDVSRARSAVQRARDVAPGLFLDGADADAPDDPDATSRAALEMMRGNRSSSFVTYFTPDGRLRFVPPPRVEAVRLEG